MVRKREGRRSPCSGSQKAALVASSAAPWPAGNHGGQHEPAGDRGVQAGWGPTGHGGSLQGLQGSRGELREPGSSRTRALWYRPPPGCPRAWRLLCCIYCPLCTSLQAALVSLPGLITSLCFHKSDLPGVADQTKSERL